MATSRRFLGCLAVFLQVVLVHCHQTDEEIAFAAGTNQFKFETAKPVRYAFVKVVFPLLKTSKSLAVVVWLPLDSLINILILKVCGDWYHAVSGNRILWVHAGFWWYHGILVVHLQDSVGAFWAIKDRGTSIRGLFVENVMTDGLSRVCSWWCMMLFLIIKITGIYFVGDQC